MLPAAQQDDPLHRQLRMKMVEEQIVREGIKDEAVLKAMREVPRHLFVSPEQSVDAYYDKVVTIGYSQTLSPGYIVAYETNAINPKPTDRVLEIGTGSGYQAAILSKIVKEVYTIEILEPLGKQATARLKALGYTNVKTKIGDGYKGWPEYAPFDKILVTCSPEDVPQALIDQLKEGGRMIIPLGERFNQAFYLFEKNQGKLVKKKLLPTLFVPMTGLAEANRKVPPDLTNPHIVNGGFEKETDGIADGWYYQRQAVLEHDDAPEGKNYMTFSNDVPGRHAQALQAFGVDGAKVKTLRLSLRIKAQKILPGGSLAIHYYDAENRQVDVEEWGPFLGSFPWRRFVNDIPVHPKAKEAVLLIGLNGATGKMSIDDVSLKPILR